MKRILTFAMAVTVLLMGVSFPVAADKLPSIANYGYLDQNGKAITTLYEETEIRAYADIENTGFQNDPNVGVLILSAYQDGRLVDYRQSVLEADSNTYSRRFATEPITIPNNKSGLSFKTYILKDAQTIRPIVEMLPLQDALPSASRDGEVYASDIKTALALGLIDMSNDGTFHADQPVTRAELAKSMVLMAGMGNAADNAKNKEYFSDVPSTNAYSGYINLAKELGYISGDNDGLFRPSKLITVKDATKEMVALLNYTYQVQTENEYTIAISIGLMDDISNIESDLVSKGTLSKLIINALSIPYVEKIGSNYIIQDGDNNSARRTLLENKLHIVKLKAFIKNTNEFSSNSSLTVTAKIINTYPSAFSEDFVINTIYQLLAGTSRAEDLIGSTAILYVRHDGVSDDMIVSTQKISEGELTVRAEDIDSIASVNGMLQVAYWPTPEATKTEKITLSSNSSLFINNAPSYVNLTDLFTSGTAEYENYLNIATIRFAYLDSSSQADYDSIFIDSYENFVVDYVNPSTKKVYSKAGNLSYISYDSSDSSIRSSLYSEAGIPVSFDTLQENDVLSVKQVNENLTVTKAYLIRRSISGTVSEIDNGGPKSKYKINDTWYTADSNTCPLTLANGDFGTFSLDIMGNIVAFIPGNPNQYAYIINTAADSNVFTTAIEIRWLDQWGIVQIVKTTDRIQLNGTPVDADTALDRIKANQLITYQANSSGYITEINHPYATTSASAENSFTLFGTGDTLVYDLSGYLTTSAAYSANAQSLTTAYGKIYIAPSTKIFIAPNGATEDEEYYLFPTYLLDQDYTLENAIAFDVDPQTKIAQTIVLKTAPNIIPPVTNQSNDPAIVISRSTTTDSYNRSVYRYTVLQAGETKTLDTNHISADMELQKGTVFVPQYDSGGQISSVVQLAQPVNSTPSFSEEALTNSPPAETTYYYGKVVDRRTSIITVMQPSGATNDIALTGAKFALFDGRNASSNQVMVGSSGDIDLRQRTSSGSTQIEYGRDIKNIYILVREYNGVIKDAFIFIFKGTPTTADLDPTVYQ